MSKTKTKTLLFYINFFLYNNQIVYLSKLMLITLFNVSLFLTGMHFVISVLDTLTDQSFLNYSVFLTFSLIFQCGGGGAKPSNPRP